MPSLPPGAKLVPKAVTPKKLRRNILDPRQFRTPLGLFLKRAEISAQKRAVSSPQTRAKKPQWTTLTWEHLREQLTEVTRGLQVRGFQPTERLALFAPTDHRWIEMFFATQALGGVASTIIGNEGIRKVEALFRHNMETHPQSFPSHLYIGPSSRLETVADLLREFPELRVITSDAPQSLPEIRGLENRITTLDQIREDGRRTSPRLLYDLESQLDPDQQAMNSKTSGSSGLPKPIGHTHRAINLGTGGIIEVRGFDFKEENRILSVANYGHIMGIIELGAHLSMGLHTYYMAGHLARLIDWFPQVKPHLFAATPRFHIEVLFKIRQRLRKEGTPRQQALVELAFELATGNRDRRDISLLDRIMLHILKRKFGNRMGGNLQMVLSGGSKLPRDTARIWHEVFGVELREGYGQTEGFLYTVTSGHISEAGDLGKSVPGIEIFTLDNHIMVQGPMVFRDYGYDLNPLTPRTEAFDTGDLGDHRSNGNLFMMGRRDRMYNGPGGENIYPEAIEERYAEEDAVRNIVVLGRDGLNYALIDPRRELILEHHSDPKIFEKPDFHKDRELREFVEARIKAGNAGFPKHEAVDIVLIIPEEATMDNNLLAGPQKPAYKLWQERFGYLIEEALEEAKMKRESKKPSE